jgi:hypothetical protein
MGDIDTSKDCFVGTVNTCKIYASSAEVSTLSIIARTLRYDSSFAFAFAFILPRIVIASVGHR